MRKIRLNSLSKAKMNPCNNRRAVALVLTLVVLVVLTTVVYALASRVAQAGHRRQYLIDYQISRYACDSALKYALSALREMDFELIDRKDKPDFSDVFTMSREEYEQYLDEWAQKQPQKEAESAYEDEYETTDQRLDVLKELLESFDSDIDPNLITTDYSEPNAVFIPGPYGPEWPKTYDPIKFDIGQTNITIEIADENAKMPLTWLAAEKEQVRKLALNALDMFGAWMQMDPLEIQMLSEQLEEVKELKQFTINPKAIEIRAQRTRSNQRSRARSGSRGTASTRRITLPPTTHTTDFAKLLHGSAIDFQILTRPLPDTEGRDEFPLKYLATWGSDKVNINTAPRHVLEAAFTFGGDAEDIADETIRRRHEKPFKDIKDLEDALYRYSQSIRKSKEYITTTSEFFTITVTASHGRARTQAVAMVKKTKKIVIPIAIITQS